MNRRLAYYVAFWCAGVVLSAGAQTPSPAPTNTTATLSGLRDALTSHVSQPQFNAAMWGIRVVSLDTGEVVFEQNAQKLFSPASNSKLFTVAMALDVLGADYRIRTSVYGRSKPDSEGNLDGDLVVYGRGDPTFNSRLNGGDIYLSLEPLAKSLAQAGLKNVQGDLLADASFFRGSEYGSGWTCDDPQAYYGAEISALTINDNTLRARIAPGLCEGAPCSVLLDPATDYVVLSNRLQTVNAEGMRNVTVYRPLGGNLIYLLGTVPLGSNTFEEDVTIHDPAGLFGRMFREALQRQGIQVAGSVRTVDWLYRQINPIQPGKLEELAFTLSPPLRDLAREVQKPSQNLYTDLLLAHAGEKARSPQTRQGMTSEELGVGVLNGFVRRAGVRPDLVVFEEGSGLSRNNLVAPLATTALLQYMDQHPYSRDFIASLPIAGVDGTLRSRMKGTAAAGRLKAKTGTLRWANALSGYVTTLAGERLVFSIMLNRYNDGGAGRSARSELDTVAVLLAGCLGRTR